MKKHIIVLIVIPCVFCLAQNLLQNPGFESWTGGLPDYWQKDDTILVFQEDVVVHSGDFSVKDSLIDTCQSYADFFQGRFPVTANTQYTYSIWVWDDDQAGRVRQGVYWWPTGYLWSTEYSADMSGWQELSYTLTSPADAESALVLVRAYDILANWDGGAVFYLDDAYFQAPSIQPPVIVRSWHTPTNPGAGVTGSVYAKATDDGYIEHDTLYYGVNGLSSPIATSHTAVNTDTFIYQIPGQAAGDTVFYYLRFIDNDSLETFSDTHAYYVGALDIYVNEVCYDTYSADSGCFIELYGPSGTSLDGFSLVGVNGTGGVEYETIDLSGGSIPGDGFFVVGDYATVPNVDLVDPGANLQNGPDNLELRFNDITIDALGYGELDSWVFTGEWLPAVDVDFGHSLGRYPDGDDTDNNEVDFNDYETLTPGEPNPPVGIYEHATVAKKMPMPILTNPLRAGSAYGALINDVGYYPLIVYNTMGQAITEISQPENRLALPTGVYFVKFNNVARGCAKIVVIK